MQKAITKAGGQTNILNETRTLFTRLSQQTNSAPFYTASDYCLHDLSGLTSLGDVFYYQPDHIRVRVHNSHFDTYFIVLVNPDQPVPADFERIEGNVGFLKQ